MVSRGIRDGLVSVAGLGVVLAALIAIDARVRDRFWGLLADASNAGSLGDRLAEFGEVLVRAARDQSLEHAPLLIFAVVTAVLVGFMLRT